MHLRLTLTLMVLFNIFLEFQHIASTPDDNSFYHGSSFPTLA